MEKNRYMSMTYIIGHKRVCIMLKCHHKLLAKLLGKKIVNISNTKSFFDFLWGINKYNRQVIKSTPQPPWVFQNINVST